jgi:hypothetical protein
MQTFSVTAYVVRQRPPTRQASTVERGRKASARMSAVVRRFNASRKWLSFIGFGWVGR